MIKIKSLDIFYYKRKERPEATAHRLGHRSVGPRECVVAHFGPCCSVNWRWGDACIVVPLRSPKHRHRSPQPALPVSPSVVRMRRRCALRLLCLRRFSQGPLPPALAPPQPCPCAGAPPPPRNAAVVAPTPRREAPLEGSAPSACDAGGRHWRHGRCRRWIGRRGRRHRAPFARWAAGSPAVEEMQRGLPAFGGVRSTVAVGNRAADGGWIGTDARTSFKNDGASLL